MPAGRPRVTRGNGRLPLITQVASCWAGGLGTSVERGAARASAAAAPAGRMRCRCRPGGRVAAPGQQHPADPLARASPPSSQHVTPAARTARNTRAPSAGRPTRATRAAGTIPAATFPARRSTAATAPVTAPRRAAAGRATQRAAAAPPGPAGPRMLTAGADLRRHARFPTVRTGTPRHTGPGPRPAAPGPRLPSATRRRSHPPRVPPESPPLSSAPRACATAANRKAGQDLVVARSYLG